MRAAVTCVGAKQAGLHPVCVLCGIALRSGSPWEVSPRMEPGRWWDVVMGETVRAAQV